MDFNSFISLLIQIPLVGIFVWFVLERDKRMESSAIKRDADWRAFLREQREQNNAALSRLADEIKSIGQLTATSNTLITQNQSLLREINGGRAVRRRARTKRS